MKLSRLLKCLNHGCDLGIRIENDSKELNCIAGNVPFWLSQMQIISAKVTEGKLSIVVS